MKLSTFALSLLLAPLALAHRPLLPDEVLLADGSISVPALEMSNPLSALVGRDLGSINSADADTLVGRAAMLETRGFCPGKSHPNLCHPKYCCPGPRYKSCCQEKKIKGCFTLKPQFVECCHGDGAACDFRRSHCCRTSPTGCCAN